MLSRLPCQHGPEPSPAVLPATPPSTLRLGLCQFSAQSPLQASLASRPLPALQPQGAPTCCGCPQLSTLALAVPSPAGNAFPRMASSLGAFKSWLKNHFPARPGWGPPASPPDPLFSLRVGPLYLAGCLMASCAATSLIVSGALWGPGPSFPSLGYPGLLALYPAHSRHATNTCHMSPCPLCHPLGPSAVCTRRERPSGSPVQLSDPARAGQIFASAAG